MTFKPRLLRETAEIALTEIKRFIEPRLIDELSLRRVSAPLILPASSPLLDSRYPGVRVSLPGMPEEAEIVGSLDVWLRGQLARYDIAPGFGVFTIMNALRPATQLSAVASPHIATWAWQQAVEPANADKKTMADVARHIYTLLVDAEQMILSKFLHLTATLQKTLDVVDEDELARMLPDYGDERRIYEYLHPDFTDRPDRRSPDGKHCAALFVSRGGKGRRFEGEIWVWNRILNRALRIVDVAVWDADAIATDSIGGNIYRDHVALQLLHQNKLLVK